MEINNNEKVLSKLKEIETTYLNLNSEHIDLKEGILKSDINLVNESLEQILEKILHIYEATNYKSPTIINLLKKNDKGIEKNTKIHKKIDSMKMEMRELFIHHNTQIMQKLEDQIEFIKNNQNSNLSQKTDDSKEQQKKNKIGEIGEIIEEPEEFPVKADYILESSSLSPHFLPGKNTVIEYADQNDYLVTQVDNCYSIFKDRKYLTSFRNSKNKSEID